MNLIKTTGTEITSSDYSQPDDFPTMEWGADEIRSYDNYIRPIRILIENDSMLSNEIKSFSDFIFNGKNGKIYGCNEININNAVAELSSGVFVYDGKLYQIYPQCEFAKQIMKKKIPSATEITVEYLEKEIESRRFHIKVVLASGQKETWSNSAYLVLNEIITELGITANPIDFKLMPMFTYGTNKRIVFKNGILQYVVPASGDFVIHSAPSVEFKDNFIPVTSLKSGERKVKIGSTDIFMNGDAVTSLSGINSINNVGISGSSNTITISNGTTTISASKSFALKDACAKEVAATVSSENSSKLPTVNAIISYKDSLFSGDNTLSGNNTFSGNNTYINKNLIVGSESTGNVGTISNLNEGFATAENIIISTPVTLNDLSAPNMFNGGIATKKNIIAAGDIIGNNIRSLSGNVSSTSKRSAKENIKPFNESATDIINGLDIVSFNFKGYDEFKIGIIADDSHEYVSSVNHDRLDHVNSIGLLFKAIQELSAENAELRRKLDGIINN